ncbi:hypothetical protein CVIRNUC_003685 [Coccomyxa viridis]|uniref:Bacteriophage T5 Orf172 DNA-binding domain-containing protein n=1 Tax=Coccomyxa viridis TaxID=1274662 RepID=A0AAV1I2B4_9CHLO|nr:hypothetical protein CVIRNUC_003685 [Coccomyxa viridis]
MLSTFWQSASGFSSAARDVTNSTPSSRSSVGRAISPSAQTGTPFTDYVLSRLPDEESQKLFALSFGEYLHHDPDALDIDFDDVFQWLGIDRKGNALRLLKREFSTDEYIVLLKEDNSAPGAGRPRDVYKMSFNQFEELIISAQTPEGKRARRLVLLLKKILQDYIIAEQVQQARAAQGVEAARANALQQQLDGLRAQQQHLYCFRLFGNRFKIGIAKDVDRRIRQHTTSCPSGHLVYSVPIACKAMEKVLESVMRTHSAWIKMEEYELTLSDEQIKAVFDVITRVEELLNVTPLEEYDTLLTLLDHRLRTDVRTQVVLHTSQHTPAETSSPRPIVSPYKAVIDAWLVHMLQHGTLPTGEIQSEHLRSRLLAYARSGDAGGHSQSLALTANKMKEHLLPYFGKGIENRKSSCSHYTFDFDTLRDTMGCSIGI